MNSGGRIPLLAKEGWPPPSKTWSRSEQARTGWSFASDVSECILKHLRVSDHPVCGASVASRLFIDAAATPPHEEGNAPRLNNSRTTTKIKFFPHEAGRIIIRAVTHRGGLCTKS